MKKVKLFEQFVNEGLMPNTPIFKKTDKGLAWNVPNSSMFRALRKMVSDLGKKSLSKAYTDGTDIVNYKTNKTIISLGPKMTLAQAAKGIEAWAKKNEEIINPPKMNKSVGEADLIEIKSDTRAIVACSMRDAKRIKEEVHNSKAKIKVRIMERKDGAKVYIDTADKDGLAAAIAQVKQMGIKK